MTIIYYIVNFKYLSSPRLVMRQSSALRFLAGIIFVFFVGIDLLSRIGRDLSALSFQGRFETAAVYSSSLDLVFTWGLETLGIIGGLIVLDRLNFDSLKTRLKEREKIAAEDPADIAFNCPDCKAKFRKPLSSIDLKNKKKDLICPGCKTVLMTIDLKIPDKGPETLDLAGLDLS